MATTDIGTADGASAHFAQERRWGDSIFRSVTLLMALSVFALMILLVVELVAGSHLAIGAFGVKFLTTSAWNPVRDTFGALTPIYGTLLTSAIALLIAVPLSVATAVYLTEMAPRWLREPMTVFIELLAAIPSVILGLWGLFVLVPWVREDLGPALKHTFGFLPLFRGPNTGYSVLTAGIIIAIMIVPIITSVSREILRSVPGLQREAAYALGATRWEVTRIAVLSYARRGLLGAVVLGLGRALGETMAAAMVIGNSSTISASLLAPGATLATKIALEFSEANYVPVLVELGLVLLGMTVLVNIGAQLLLKTFGGPGVKPQN